MNSFMVLRNDTLPFKTFINGQSLTTNLVVPKITTPLNIFLLDMNFDKSTIRLHFLLIFSMFANFQKIKYQ